MIAALPVTTFSSRAFCDRGPLVTYGNLVNACDPTAQIGRRKSFRLERTQKAIVTLYSRHDCLVLLRALRVLFLFLFLNLLLQGQLHHFINVLNAVRDERLDEIGLIELRWIDVMLRFAVGFIQFLHRLFG